LDTNGEIVNLRDYINGCYKTIFISKKHRELYFRRTRVGIEEPLVIPCKPRKRFSLEELSDTCEDVQEKFRMPEEKSLPRLRSKRSRIQRSKIRIIYNDDVVLL
jgi:hypothetical protein